jgi:hypothetical protein
MPGTVFNSTSFRVELYNPVTQNPATIASGAIITNVTGGYNGDAVYGSSSAVSAIYNFGQTSIGTKTSAGEFGT